MLDSDAQVALCTTNATDLHPHSWGKAVDACIATYLLSTARLCWVRRKDWDDPARWLALPKLLAVVAAAALQRAADPRIGCVGFGWAIEASTSAP